MVKCGLMESPSAMPVPPDVYDRESAEAFVRWCVENVGLGYHPDTAFEDYVDADGEPAFAADAVRSLNELNARTLNFCAPYDIGLAEVRRQFTENRLL